MWKFPYFYLWVILRPYTYILSSFYTLHMLLGTLGWKCVNIMNFYYIRNTILCTHLSSTHRAEAEKVVGWAKNHYLASCVLPSVKGDRLYLPFERYFDNLLKLINLHLELHWHINSPFGSLEIAISRMKEQETVTRKPSVNLKAHILLQPFCSSTYSKFLFRSSVF